MLRVIANLWLGSMALGLVFVGTAACGDVNIRDGMTAGYESCQSYDSQFHFKVLIPPWKYNKEYRCSQCTDGICTGLWNPTGRYVWVVSDVPFVNYDSEIITSMDVEYVTGSTANLVSALVATEGVGVAYIEAAPELAALMLVFTAWTCMLGLHFSLRSRR